MANNGSALHFGAFEVDLATGELRRNGRTVKLQPQPFKILAVLLERPGELVTREEIQRKVWGEGTFVDFEHSLNFAVKKVRDALSDDADRPRYIETLPKRGYRFIAAIEEDRRSAASRETSQQPAITPARRVTSIGEGLRASQQAIPVEVAGDGSTAILAVAEVPTVSKKDEQEHGNARPERSERDTRATLPRGRLLIPIAVVLLAGAAASYVHVHSRSVPKLTEKDTIVLADFTNTTGDPVFDGTLRQGLSAQLEQSPFLNLLSDDRIAETLGLMTQPKDARLTYAFAREVCLRTASAATIEGSIAKLGSQYVVGLKAVNCQNGEALAEEQATGDRKEHVLKALGEAATKLRTRLGESLASIQKYNAPPENVTTPSLEALQAYSLGYRAHVVKENFAAAVPLFQRAISLDPNFAMAWERLGISYYDLGEIVRAAEAARKAYQLRERSSERERFYIDSQYEDLVIGDLGAERKIDELWAQTYPLDPVPPLYLGEISAVLGEYQKSLSALREALRLEPESALIYGNLVQAYLDLDRLDEAKAAAQEARARDLDSPIIHSTLYQLDFLEHDLAGMGRENAQLMGTPEYEEGMLNLQSNTAAYAGQFVKARELSRRAFRSAERAGEKEIEAGFGAEAAIREALAGNTRLARQQVQAALALSKGRDVEGMSAIALGMAGDSAQATQLANNLSRRFPKDTTVQSEYLPMICAAAILGSDNASKDADQVVQTLAAATPYELGNPDPSLTFALYPAYLRAEGYLAAREGASAVTEFQKILDHPGIVLNEPIGALAQLGLGRAYVLEARGTAVPAVKRQVSATTTGGTPVAPSDALAKARIAYQDFFALWKDADPDLPILRKAKAEYARLQQPE